MTNNFTFLKNMLNFNNEDDFYILIVVDINLFLPYIITKSTNINVLETSIKRICKKSGKAYLYLNKKSFRKLTSCLAHECIMLLVANKTGYNNIKNIVRNICSTDRCSNKDGKMYVCEYVNIPFYKKAYLVEVEEKLYIVGYIKDVKKNFLKWLKLYHMKSVAKILIYSK